MATIVIPERFNGNYNGTIPSTLLKEGWISSGKNVRKVSQDGGWKVRKGAALHSTSALGGGVAIKSQHYYTNPFSLDEHFIAQCNAKLYYESAQNELPPTVDNSFGTDLGVTVGTVPGFSTGVGEYLFYADGSGRPIVWGGVTPRVKGLVVYDASEAAYLDYSRNVTDGRTDTYAVVLGAATDGFYIYTEERISGVTLDLGTNVNVNAVTLVVKAWRAGAWAVVSGLVDGTLDVATNTKTLAKDGTVSWTANGNDLMRAYQGIQGYAYEFSWSGALSGSVFVVSANCTQAATLMTNKWNGEFNYVSGCRFFNNTLGQYIELLGKVTNESTSMYVDLSSSTTSDFLYIKTPEPACLFGLAVVDGYGNTAAAAIDQIDYWNGDSWVAITTNLSDTTKESGGTKSFAQTGMVGFDATAIIPQRRLLVGDPIPGYWYRISWAAALSADTRVYAILYGAYPETLPAYDGCVEFKNRLMLWGDPEFPNRLRYSARNNPFCFSGADSGWTDAVGAMDSILLAVRYYNELVIFKEKGIWLLEGESPGTFGTLKIADKVGIASPKTGVVAEVGFPSMHRDEPMTIVIWQDTDGVYTFDGRKTKKESGAVDNYFNPEESTCIAAASIRNLQGFTDPNNNEYHLILPTGELVFNYVTAEWFPLWERAIPLTTGLSFNAIDNRDYTYGGSSAGWIQRLETDTTDKSVANADVAINHSIKTRAIGYEKTERAVRFSLTKIMAELKVRTAGLVTVKTFKDRESTGISQVTPTAMSMIKTGYNITVPSITCNPTVEECKCFEVEFSLNVADQEIEMYSFSYELGGRGISE